jgi:hypothetical protein
MEQSVKRSSAVVIVFGVSVLALANAPAAHLRT